LKTKRGNSVDYIEARLEKLTRSGGNPVRTLELLFAVLDEAEDKELASRIRKHLKAHGITKDSVEVAAAKPARAAPGGRPQKGDARHLLGKGQSPERLAARLARDHGGLAAEVEAGRKSLRAAAKEAGIVKPRDPLRELKRWWGRASDCDRAQFQDFIDAWHRERPGAAGRRASRMRTLSLKTGRTAYFSHWMIAATGFSAWPPTRTPSLSPYLFGASFAKYHLRASILRRDRLICSWSGIRLPLASMTKSPEPSSAISSSSSAMASKPNCRANA
jgi:hypothetical protein